ncbi:MAG: VWA domain-containing protein [Spirochaetaceae bacterium]|jgi:Ca-activated chloride channel family protein|nr:VWA domain-containing protein [Spirochaetaceae bacterium]
MSIAFDRPYLALAALVCPFVIVILKRFFLGAITLNISLGSPGGKVFAPSLGWVFFVNLLHITKILSISLLLLAASSPLIITHDRVWIDRGCDILFVLDCSPSMAGLDMNGKNRFDESRQLLKNFALNRPSDSIGLVGVGNTAALLIPPTIDRRAFISRLENMQIGELGDGTALGMGLALAALHLTNSSAPQKSIILITDGENNAGSVHPLTAAQAIKSGGISFYVIGIGSSGDVLLDYVDPITKVRHTGLFESRFNRETLETLAQEGGGTYLNAPTADAFAVAFKTVNKKEATVSRVSYKEKKQAIYEELIIIALFMVLFTRALRKFIFGSFL